MLPFCFSMTGIEISQPLGDLFYGTTARDN